MKEKYCGNCKHFYNEGADGVGLCDKNDWLYMCDEVCNAYESIREWTEITPDNVDELYNINEDLLMIAFKMGDKMYYQHKSLMRATLNTLAKSEGYYYYVLPELKIDGIK